MIDKNIENNGNGKVLTFGNVFGNLKTAVRILVVMAIVLGVAYPVLLIAIGQITMPFQSGGSILKYGNESIGSKLISQKFDSQKFFHPRPSSDSASGVDPHVTPENAFAQVKNVSSATGIHENTLKTLINLNIEQNKITNGLFFAPYYVNVLEVNLELVKQYPEVYNITATNMMDE